MLVIDAERTRASLAFDRLIPALREAFIAGAEAPLRHRHDLPQPDGTTASLLLMPAWQPAASSAPSWSPSSLATLPTACEPSPQAIC